MRSSAVAALCLCLAAPALTARAAEGEAPQPTGYKAVEAHDTRVYQAVAPAVVGITCRTPRSGYYGTGVVISVGGLILTSTTVVPKGATDIRIFFPGAMEKEAELLGQDEDTESALLKVDAKDLAFVPLADSAGARPGEMAYTFGNPRGTLSSDDKVSFSSGFVSGVYKLNVTGDFQSKYTDMVIETEAAVNPGSDGGALVDGQGRLLGIISLGYSERRWLGVAVPVHLIAAKFDALKDIKPPAKHLVPPAALEEREAAWRAAVKKVEPAVVQVLVRRDKKPPPKPKGLSFAQMAQEAGRRYKMRPLGPVSGVLVSPQGHVLTAYYHMTPDTLTGSIKPETLRVRLADGREKPARMLGFDKNLDLVMLKVEIEEDEKWPYVELAEDAEPRVGETLAVLGRSEDKKTVTVNRGLVSARSRGLRGVLQTSAFVNYGNTGGPAVDIEGRLVGVVGRLTPAASWGQNSGIGFVTTAESIKEIFDRLAAGEEVKPPPRTFLGVSAGPDKSEVLGAPVGRVLAGTAASDAGVKAGDIITAIDGRPVESWSGLVRNIVGRKPGEVIKLTVLRKKETLELEATLRKSSE